VIVEVKLNSESGLYISKINKFRIKQDEEDIEASQYNKETLELITKYLNIFSKNKPKYKLFRLILVQTLTLNFAI